MTKTIKKTVPVTTIQYTRLVAGELQPLQQSEVVGKLNAKQATELLNDTFEGAVLISLQTENKTYEITLENLVKHGSPVIEQVKLDLEC